MSLPGRFVDVGGQRIFYHRRRVGRDSGAPLVLVHGFLVSHWQWRHVVPALAERFDVVAFDLPGFGESDRPPPATYGYDPHAFFETLVGLLDALGLERVSLMGHSMGAAIALYTAARRPERVDRLVAVDPLCYPYRVPVEGHLLAVPVVGEALFRGLSSRSFVGRAMRRRIYRDPEVVTDDWIDYVWERMNRPGGLRAACAAMRFVADPAAIARCVRAVRAPTFVVWGEDDRLFPSAWARRLCDDVVGARCAVIPRCGHSPPEECPQPFLDAVLPWLTGAAARAAPPDADPAVDASTGGDHDSRSSRPGTASHGAGPSERAFA